MDDERKGKERLPQHGFGSYENGIHPDFDSMPSVATFAISSSCDCNLELVEHNPSSSPTDQTVLVILAANFPSSHTIQMKL